MSEPTGGAGACLHTDTHHVSYCDHCDLLVGLPDLRVIELQVKDSRLVMVESPPAEQGCRSCGVIAGSHGRRTVRLVDAPSFGRAVRIVWRKRIWECDDPTRFDAVSSLRVDKHIWHHVDERRRGPKALIGDGRSEA